MIEKEAIANINLGKSIPYKKETQKKLNEMLQENQQLKKLLKQALDDFKLIEDKTGAYICYSFFDSRYSGRECAGCLYCQVSDENGNEICCKWKHADEAEKLIDDDLGNQYIRDIFITR